MQTRIRKNVKEKLIEATCGKCPVCGAENVPLEIAHMMQISKGGKNILENLTVLCTNCHRSMDRGGYSEIEFNHYLYQLLQTSSSFTDTSIEALVAEEPYLRADIITKSAKDNKSILIECKNAAFLTGGRLESAIEQIDRYRQKSIFDSYVLAFPGRISAGGQELVRKSRIEIWDADFIANTFRKEVEKSTHPYFRTLFLSLLPLESLPIEHQLLEKLKTCQPGKKYWSDFQKLVGQILEKLFCPPLQSPISESSDIFNINRRDWIFPNYSDSGFWHFLRQTYKADYIVVDAKNYKSPISKNQVLQIANYLKPHGAGLFAIIATRSGVDRGAELTIREQWMVHNKMILVINDTDLEAMLLSSSSGGEAYKVIGQVIENFRLSM
jgi:hypothetical protein